MIKAPLYSMYPNGNNKFESLNPWHKFNVCVSVFVRAFLSVFCFFSFWPHLVGCHDCNLHCSFAFLMKPYKGENWRWGRGRGQDWTTVCGEAANYEPKAKVFPFPPLYFPHPATHALLAWQINPADPWHIPIQTVNSLSLIAASKFSLCNQ